MTKREFISRSVCFITVYLMFYLVPILVVRVAPFSLMTAVPGWMSNLFFVIPALAFPFDKIWGTNPANYIFSNVVGWMVMIGYLVSIACLFAKFSRPVRKLRWIVPLAICSVASSILGLNLIFGLCGIRVFIDSP